MSNSNSTFSTDRSSYISLEKNTSSVSSSVGLFFVASVMMTSSYPTLNVNSLMENKTASRAGPKLDRSIISFSNTTTNELIYQTSQYFEPTHKSNYQLLNDSDWITECYEKLKQLSNLPANWDSYNAEPPNNIALNWTREILKILFKMGFPPTRITPSVENGVGISFICEHKYADIECFNEGDILAVISDGKGIPEVWEVESTTLAITSTIDKIREFLQR
jgi:hypothetical protein